MTGFKSFWLAGFFLLIHFFIVSSIFGKTSPIIDVVKKASPAIVNIKTEEFVRETSQRGENILKRLLSETPEEEDFSENIGSGVVIDPKGIVLTNEHLISKAVSIKVKFMNGREYEADVLGCDPEFDLAILRIRNGSDFPYLKLKKNADLMVGQSVIVIGNPYGLSSSVSVGVISALGRNLRVENKVFGNLIQTDAAINPGNSGGALLDLDGNLIGIVTAVLGEGKGIGFAIPASDIESMISELMEAKKERPIIGIFVEKLRDGSKFSLVVKKVIEKSPADKYGLKKGDKIVEINKKKLKEGMKLKDITTMMIKGRESLQMKILREEEEQLLNLDVKEILNFKPSPVDERLLGIRVSNVSAYARLKHKIREKKGAIVMKVTKGGIGHLSGIKPGDLILKINNSPVENKDDFEKLMLESIKKNYLLYQVLRSKTIFFLPLKLENLL